MKKALCHLLAFGCLLVWVLGPLLLIYLLWDLPLLIKLFKANNSQHNIQWETVLHWQWLGIWGFMVFQLGLTLLTVYFLRPVLLQFAQGAFFNYSNSLNLRRFSLVLLIQGLIHPLGIATLLLSWNHPPGQRLLSLSFSGAEIRFISLGFLFWLVSDALVKGAELAQENEQFV